MQENIRAPAGGVSGNGRLHLVTLQQSIQVFGRGSSIAQMKLDPLTGAKAVADCDRANFRVYPQQGANQKITMPPGRS